jgi:hypothetical protein
MNTAPAWDNTKQGWYSPTAGEENYRCIGGCTKSGASYTSKFVLLSLNTIGLKSYTDRVAFMALNDIQIGELIIGDLKMYAYGDLEILNCAPGETKEFYLMKPVYCYVNIHDQNAGTPDPYLNIYYNATYNAFMTYVDNGLHMLYPGRYKAFGGITADYVTIRCLYAEGLNALDIDKILLMI